MWEPFVNICKSEEHILRFLGKAQILAESESLHFLETSALRNVNVEQAFTLLLTDIYTAAAKKLFASEDSEEKDLDGSRIELGREEKQGGLFYWSCCGAVTRMLSSKAPEKKA